MKINKKYFWTKFLGLFCLILLSGALLAACGYATPAGGGGLTPYVVIVTPTLSLDKMTATAEAGLRPPPPTNTALPQPTNQPTIKTPAPVNATPTPAGTLTVSGDFYTVQAGDTLIGISIRLKVDVDDLIALNKGVDPNSLQIGQKLKVPPRTTAAPAPTKTPAR